METPKIQSVQDSVWLGSSWLQMQTRKPSGTLLSIVGVWGSSIEITSEEKGILVVVLFFVLPNINQLS